MGTEAVLALMEGTATSQPVVIALSGNQTVRVPLMHCVEKTLAVAQAMAAKRFKEAQELRGRSFKGNLETYIRLSKLRPKLFSSKQVRRSVRRRDVRSRVKYSTCGDCTRPAIRDKTVELLVNMHFLSLPG